MLLFTVRPQELDRHQCQAICRSALQEVSLDKLCHTSIVKCGSGKVAPEQQNMRLSRS